MEIGNHPHLKEWACKANNLSAVFINMIDPTQCLNFVAFTTLNKNT